MKKSIKYAGIAAATLLAVAPVAAPVVSTTTAQAATDTPDTEKNGATADATALSQSVNQFNGKFSGSIEANDLLTNQRANLNSFAFTTNNQTYADFMESATAKVIANATDTVTLDPVFNSNNDKIDADDVLGNTHDATEKTPKGANMTITSVTGQATISNGTTRFLNNATELKAALKDSTVKSIALTVSYQYYNTNGDLKKGSTTKTINNTDMALSEMNVSFTTPYTVALNQTVTDSQLIDGTDLKITDQNGDGIAVSQVTPSANYYTSARAASNRAASKNDGKNGLVGSDVVETSSDKKNNTTQTATPKFKKAGSYYQGLTVKFARNSAAAKFLAAVQDNPSANTLTINGVKFGDIDTDNYNLDTENYQITFARKIVVSSDASQWTTVENKGVVTTKSATPYYTLVNDNNQKIANRALAKNSAWITDQKRTDQNGNVQYRVATGEWINADNVTFSDKATTDQGEYTDVQALNGKVTLDGPSSFVYFLYNNNGEQIANRALTGDSAWFTDKKATNAAGVTVYHVATGEWVQAGNGVNYSAY